MNGFLLALVATSWASAQHDLAGTPPGGIEPPDIIRVVVSAPGQETMRRRLLVRPDGTVSLPPHGAVYVAGLSTDAAAGQIRDWLAMRLECRSEEVSVSVEVVKFRTPHVWIVTRLEGQDQKLYSLALTGDETVLDAIVSVPQVPAVCSKCEIWVERRTGAGALMVDWIGIVQRARTETNYSLQDGDLVHVSSARVRPSRTVTEQLRGLLKLW